MQLPLAFGYFALVMIPLTLLIGLAAAVIGFTSWMLIVPVLFVAFSFQLGDAVLIACSLDFVNSCILLVMSRSVFSDGRWRQLAPPVLVTAPVALAACVCGLFFMDRFLQLFKSRIRSGVGYLLLVLAALFLLKGIFAWRKKRQLEAQQGMVQEVEEEEEVPLMPVSKEPELEAPMQLRPFFRTVWRPVLAMLVMSRNRPVSSDARVGEHMAVV